MQNLNGTFKEAFEKIVAKGENAGHQHFLLFPQCFLTYKGNTAPLKPPRNCRLQMLTIWMLPKFCCLIQD